MRGGGLLLAAAVALGLAAGCGGKDGGREAEGPPPAAERYYVRLRASADPRAVADRHGVEPIEVITEHATAFYAALTPAEVEGLRGDTLVISLSREIHQGRDTARAGIRGVGPAPSDTSRR